MKMWSLISCAVVVSACLTMVNTASSSCDDIPSSKCWSRPDDNCVGRYEGWARANCPLRCGYCDGSAPPCEDALSYCSLYLPETCVQKQYEVWARENCRKTCNKCYFPSHNATTKTPSNGATTNAPPTTRATSPPPPTTTTTTSPVTTTECHGVKWASGSLSEGTVVRVAEGDTLTLNWTFVHRPSELTLDIQWFFSGRSSEMIATLASGHFFTTASFSGRARETTNAGLEIDHVTMAESGNYSLEVLARTHCGVASLRSFVTVVVEARKPRCHQCGDLTSKTPCTEEEIYDSVATDCNDSNIFCMTDAIKEYADAPLKIIKRCVNEVTCLKDYFLQNLQTDYCQHIDTAIPEILACHLCCHGEGCNSGLVPPRNTLYVPTSTGN